MSLGGYPSLVSFSNSACRSFEKTSWQFVLKNLKLQFKTSLIISEIESIIIELDLENNDNIDRSALSARSRALNNQLNVFEAEFSSFESLESKLCTF